eukprot:TRINITY_DN1446_c0_g2_i1.p1 TRINITY_DN1446_c0_g2~~TRINITY_DN1446_c0_g2_i1.p1  ORF type:complete len:411 (-),score=70.26 TRINITY_DN1446_c0_g2_i1:103-1335(-)
MGTFCFRWVAILAAIATASGWTYIPISDELLVESSHSAVVGTVEEEFLPGTFDFGSMRHYKIRIERELRTDRNFRRSEDNSFVLHVNGGFDAADRSFYYVPGAPEFQVGERAIFFVHHEEEKDFHRLSQFALGVFREAEVNGRSVALRPFEIERRRSESIISVRKFDEFADWIEQLSRAQKRDVYATVEANYFVDVETAHLTNSKRYNLLTDYITRLDTRWPSMPLTYEWAGVEPPFQNTGGGKVQFNLAAKIWNDQPNTPIQILLGGHHVPPPPPQLPLRDQKNQISFEDYYNQIPGQFCYPNVRNDVGGVLSLTGLRIQEDPSSRKRSPLGNTNALHNSPGSFSPMNHTWRGQQWTTVSEADINLQDHLECYTTTNQVTASNIIANILTHELGHALGLAVLMRRKVPF